MKNEKRQRLAACSILISILLFTAILILYQCMAVSIKEDYTDYENTIKESEFDKITVYINELSKEAYAPLVDIASDIEKDINKQYPDLSILKKEFDSNKYDNIYSILDDHIYGKYFNGVDNDGNDMFVATSKRIIADYSYSDAQYVTDSCKYRDWSTFTDKDNYILAENCRDAILNQSNNIIFYENDNNLKNHRTVTDLSLDELKKVYYEEGLDGLKYYEFLVSVYITDSGDIFGSDDIVGGMRYDNYKLVVVQSFNIYDQIKAHYPDMIYREHQEYNENLLYLYLVGILLVIECIIVLIGSSKLFNDNVLKK